MDTPALPVAVKSKHLKSSPGCFQHARDNEPLFTLLARDLCAAETVKYWAYLASGGRPLDFVVPVSVPRRAKVEDALECAAEMEAYPLRKMPD